MQHLHTVNVSPKVQINHSRFLRALNDPTFRLGNDFFFWGGGSLNGDEWTASPLFITLYRMPRTLDYLSRNFTAANFSQFPTRSYIMHVCEQTSLDLDLYGSIIRPLLKPLNKHSRPIRVLAFIIPVLQLNYLFCVSFYLFRKSLQQCPPSGKRKGAQQSHSPWI